MDGVAWWPVISMVPNKLFLPPVFGRFAFLDQSSRRGATFADFSLFLIYLVQNVTSAVTLILSINSWNYIFILERNCWCREVNTGKNQLKSSLFFVFKKLFIG